jgi:hypothetical protein
LISWSRTSSPTSRPIPTVSHPQPYSIQIWIIEDRGFGPNVDDIVLLFWNFQRNWRSQPKRSAQICRFLQAIWCLPVQSTTQIVGFVLEAVTVTEDCQSL